MSMVMNELYMRQPRNLSTSGSRHEEFDYRAAATPRTALISPFTYD